MFKRLFGITSASMMLFNACGTSNQTSTLKLADEFPTKPASALEIIAKIETGGSDFIGLGFGSAWTPSGGNLLRIDPMQHKVVAKIKIGSGPYRGVSTGLDHVWTPNTGDKTISKIDPKTNTVVATYPISLAGGSEGSVGVGDGSLWAVTDNGGTKAGTLSRMNASDGKIVADIPVANGSSGVVFESGFVFVSGSSENTVKKIDPKTNTVVATIEVDKSPRFITSGEGSVWALCQTTGRVARIDAATGKVIAMIDAKSAGGGGDISYGEGAVWVTMPGKPITRISTTTNLVVRQFQGGGFGDALRAGLGAVWVSGSFLWQINPNAQ